MAFVDKFFLAHTHTTGIFNEDEVIHSEKYRFFSLSLSPIL
jgi:hypothetical protein